MATELERLRNAARSNGWTVSERPGVLVCRKNDQLVTIGFTHEQVTDLFDGGIPVTGRSKMAKAAEMLRRLR